MTLKEHIDDIREGLKTNRYPDEAAVSQGIVLRLLGTLGWSTYDTQAVFPQYGVEARKVDFALCHPPSKPIVFLEVKRVGNIEGAERQLFEYAFHEGVPIAILTDGREWRFFHPIAQGDYRERKVCELNLSEGNSEESAERLNRYLKYESIRTGEAVEALKKDYEKVIQQRQVEARLPEVWNELVQEKNEDLLLIVMDAAKNKIGYEPTEEQILDFLKTLKKERKLDHQEARSLPIPQPTSINKRSNIQSKAPAKLIVVTMPNGEVIKEYSGIGTFVKVIEKLIGEYGEEVVLRAADGRPIISTSPFNYPGKRDKRLGRFYISTNHGTDAKKTYLDYIANRLDLDNKLRVDIVNKP